jgi:hypothetical protein
MGFMIRRLFECKDILICFQIQFEPEKWLGVWGSGFRVLKNARLVLGTGFWVLENEQEGIFDVCFLGGSNADIQTGRPYGA